MFLKLTFFVAILVSTTWANTENSEKLSDRKEIPAVIPDEIAEFLKNITAEEMAILKDMAKEYKSFKNEDEALAALKEKSPSLHEKAVKLHAFIKTKVDALGDEAKDFVKKILAERFEIYFENLAGNKPSLDELKAKAKIHVLRF